MFNLNLSIHRFDGGRTNTFEDTIEIYSSEYSDAILKEAKMKVEQFVNEQWKTANVLTSRKKMEKITVLYDDLKDWINIKRSINTMSIINKYNVTNFSHNKATIILSYSGNLNQLKVAFSQSDLDFNLSDKKLNLSK